LIAFRGSKRSEAWIEKARQLAARQLGLKIGDQVTVRMSRKITR
jgi:hypothetical protein